MKRCLLAAYVLILVLLPIGRQCVSAQNTSLSESQFWQRLDQTEVLLRATATESDLTAAVSQIRALWDGVSQIQLEDGTRVTVDLGWIQAPLIDAQPNELEALHRQVKALIDYHENQTGLVIQSGKSASLESLAEVLRDPRFQYVDVTPTPIPDAPPEEVSQSTAIFSIAQAVLLFGGIAVVIVLFVYFARNLQIQGASIESVQNSDPTTSSDAQTLATDHAQSQDYRSAVRYLYLASLLILDERGIIHYDSSLTNREHLRYLRDKPQIYDLLRQVINAFEEVWYGYFPIDEAYYQRFRHQVDELNRMVA